MLSGSADRFHGAEILIHKVPDEEEPTKARRENRETGADGKPVDEGADLLAVEAQQHGGGEVAQQGVQGQRRHVDPEEGVEGKSIGELFDFWWDAYLFPGGLFTSEHLAGQAVCFLGNSSGVSGGWLW